MYSLSRRRRSTVSAPIDISLSQHSRLPRQYQRCGATQPILVHALTGSGSVSGCSGRAVGKRTITRVIGDCIVDGGSVPRRGTSEMRTRLWDALKVRTWAQTIRFPDCVQPYYLASLGAEKLGASVPQSNVRVMIISTACAPRGAAACNLPSTFTIEQLTTADVASRTSAARHYTSELSHTDVNDRRGVRTVSSE